MLGVCLALPCDGVFIVVKDGCLFAVFISRFEPEVAAPSPRATMSAQWRDVEQRYSHGHHGDSSHRASNHNNDDDDFDDDGDSGYDASRLLDGASGGGSEDALLARIRQLQLARHDIDHRMRSLDGYASAGRNSVATFPSLPPALPPITSQQHNAGRASY